MIVVRILALVFSSSDRSSSPMVQTYASRTAGVNAATPDAPGRYPLD